VSFSQQRGVTAKSILDGAIFSSKLGGPYWLSFVFVLAMVVDYEHTTFIDSESSEV
jgi:hypothetical protein